jgi:hypothetical protein
VNAPQTTARAEVEGIRRELFQFRSGPDQLYASVYVGPRPEIGVVVCPGWHADFVYTLRSIHGLALGVARRGGAALVFHWPGQGESGGDLEYASMERLGEAAVHAVAAAQQHWSGDRWRLAGLRLGAAAAALAAQEVGAERLVLVEPALDPAVFLATLGRRAPGMTGGGWRLGHPIPGKMTDETAGAEIRRAVTGFRGEGAALAYERSGFDDALPERWRRTTVPGTWTTQGKHDRLFAAALDATALGDA